MRQPPQIGAVSEYQQLPVLPEFHLIVKRWNVENRDCVLIVYRLKGQDYLLRQQIVLALPNDEEGQSRNPSDIFLKIPYQLCFGEITRIDTQQEASTGFYLSFP